MPWIIPHNRSVTWAPALQAAWWTHVLYWQATALGSSGAVALAYNRSLHNLCHALIVRAHSMIEPYACGSEHLLRMGTRIVVRITVWKGFSNPIELTHLHAVPNVRSLVFPHIWMAEPSFVCTSIASTYSTSISDPPCKSSRPSTYARSIRRSGRRIDIRHCT